MTDPVSLGWLDGGPRTETGVRWGVPWPRGAVDRDDAFALVGPDGDRTAVQTWPTAFWPDGSVKWTGHAAVLGPDAPAEPTLEPAAAAPDLSTALTVERAGDGVTVDTGPLRAEFGGGAVVDELAVEDAVVGRNGRLVARREHEATDGETEIRRETPFASRVEDVTVEREGPVHAVVTVTGEHAPVGDGAEAWLPFEVRFSLYAGTTAVRVRHTVTYDGDPETDRVAGLGLAFDVPLDGPAAERHVRFAGDAGLFREPAQVLPPKADAALREAQVAGEPLERIPDAIDDMPAWDDFELVQDSATHYGVRKRASDDHAWVDAVDGERATGLGFAGGTDGGLALAHRNCWEAYPSALSVRGLTGDAATLTAWLWPPAAESMDLGLYDDPRPGSSGAAYGGVNPETSTARNIARTSELVLDASPDVPDGDALWDRAVETREPPRLVCEPAYYHARDAFGTWSLPDRDDPNRAWLEDQLDALVNVYLDEVAQRDWYGFWDHGDVMHSYDQARHSWLYDTGGYAWQNTEQMPTLWFWYTFLRTGRAEVFRAAEAMTRHTSEVDVYHDGPMQGLGTRHNVQHWGGGCVEARTATAAHHRPYYYLTGGDERLGAVFEEVRDADESTLAVDPMRNHTEDEEHPTHARIAPEWVSYSANWLTRWERFEDESYRDKLLTGLDDIEGMPNQMLSGSNFGYDPATGELFHIGDGNYGYAFLSCMGGPQFWPELARHLEATDGDHPDLEAMLGDVGVAYLDPDSRDELVPDVVDDSTFEKLPMYATNAAALAASRCGDDALAERVWELLVLDPDRRRQPLPIERETVTDYLYPIAELPGIKTNIACIWSLNVIAALEYVPEDLPELPPPDVER